MVHKSLSATFMPVSVKQTVDADGKDLHDGRLEFGNRFAPM